MRSGAIILFCTAVLGAPGLGQSGPPLGKSETRYVATVIGTNVYVRSTPRMSAWRCTKLNQPARVTVVGKLPGWLKILPPPGVFSVISKKFVRVDEGGKIGVVIGEKVWVRAGGTLRASSFWAHQKQLNSGDEVEVLGEIEDYYKIVPPEGVYFYISDKYVKPAESADRATKSRPAAPTTTPPPPRVLTSDRPATDVPRLVKPELPRAVELTAESPELTKLWALDAELITELKKPLEQRNLRPLLAKYQAFGISQDSPLHPYVEYYVRYLEAVLKIQEQRKAIRKHVKDTAEKQREYEMERTQLMVKATARRELIYTAKGFLKPSAIYTGGATGPKRFVLHDPETGSINAYVQSTGGNVDLSGRVDKYVGVLGETQYSPEIRARIIEAVHVKELSKSPEASAEPPLPVETTQPPRERVVVPEAVRHTGLPLVEPTTQSINEKEYD